MSQITADNLSLLLTAIIAIIIGACCAYFKVNPIVTIFSLVCFGAFMGTFGSHFLIKITTSRE